MSRVRVRVSMRVRVWVSATFRVAAMLRVMPRLRQRHRLEGEVGSAMTALDKKSCEGLVCL